MINDENCYYVDKIKSTLFNISRKPDMIECRETRAVYINTSPASPAPKKCINTSPAVYINTSPPVYINTSPATPPDKYLYTSPASEKYI